MVFERVSIVMPTLNQGRYIRAAIDSVLSQDYPDIELIVMDGGSTDGTLEILKSYGGRIVWMSGKDHGPADAINQGLGLACGNYYSWLNSDDLLAPGTVTRVMEYFKMSESVGIVYGNVLFVTGSGVPITHTIHAPFDYREMLFKAKNPICQPGTFFSRVAWLKAGGLDTSMGYFFDWDLWLRMGMDWEVVVVPEVVASYRLHHESLTVKGNYRTHELHSAYDKLEESLFEGRRAEAYAALYGRIAEYNERDGKWVRAKVMRVAAWLMRRLR